MGRSVRAVGEMRRGRCAPSSGLGRAFSLLEMVVVIAVIAILLAILLPAMSACRGAGRNLKCAGQLRKVAYDFSEFADDFAVRTRGESDQLGPGRFMLDDFQDSMYEVDEFWQGLPARKRRYDSSRQVMMCPSGPRELYRTTMTHIWGDFVFSQAEHQHRPERTFVANRRGNRRCGHHQRGPQLP